MWQSIKSNSVPHVCTEMYGIKRAISMKAVYCCEFVGHAVGCSRILSWSVNCLSNTYCAASNQTLYVTLRQKLGNNAHI